jgi:Na+-transporting NADH:ubiquinone oxidoreductase subunit A
MEEVIKLRKGYNINLKGKAEKIFIQSDPSETYAVKPIDFPGIFPKLTIQVDHDVKAGSPLFFNKYNSDVLFTSPVSGKVIAINRGERRRILEVVIQADKEIRYVSFLKADPKDLNREQIIKNLLKSGLWPFIRQRPYHIIANPEDEPKAVFISAFDTAPLAPDYDFALKNDGQYFQTGLDALSKLTSGKVHLSLNGTYPPNKIFSEAKNVELHYFSGPHPAGNVGVQIHHIDPINKGDLVWIVNAQDVVTIGRLFGKGIYDASRIVALTGSEIKYPRYYKTMNGASVSNLVEKNVENGKLRYISGNVLTGLKIPKDGFIGFYDSQITVIPEGDYYEFLGWGLPGFKKYSVSRSFFSWLTPKKEYSVDTNLKGGRRAFVMTGQYEKVLPMDIYPVQLIKAILVEDIDLMENMGIYEVAEEDFALCEFVCTSKTEVQSIIRQGIDLLIRELG